MARRPSPANESRRRTSRANDADARDAGAPWLDEGETWPDASHTLVGRRTLWIILGLATLLVLGIVVGMWVVSKRGPAPIDTLPPGAEIPLLTNPGPWKEEPEGPGTDGIEIEGQGQILFGTGDGRDPGGQIALDALPEDPVELATILAPEAAAEAKQDGPPPKELLPETLRPEAEAPKKPEPEPVPKPEPAKPASKPVEAAPAAPATGGATLQLGAFSTQARAREAWKALSSRFSYLADLEPLILPTQRDGKTLYRLRVSASSPAAARDLCGRLKVAGENCTVIS